MSTIESAILPGDAAFLPDDESAALSELTSRFEHRVHFFANRIERRFMLGSAMRDDLVSAGYWGLLQALRNRRRDVHPRALSAYVSQRIEGAVFDEARRFLGRHQRTESVDPADFEGALDHRMESPGDEAVPGRGASWLDPESAVDLAKRWQGILERLDLLGEDHREFLMAYASGSSVAELARQEGATPGRLQSRLTRLARELRGRSPELRRILRHEL